MLLTGLDSSSKVIIVTDTGRFERVKDGKCAGIISVLLIGLNSSGRVIIVADASKFKRLENRKRTSIVGVLLT